MLHAIIMIMFASMPGEDGEAPDNFIQLDRASGVTVDQVLPRLVPDRADTVIDVDPGVLPEGDYLFDITFTSGPGDPKVIVCNYMSETITVMDWSAMSIDTTFSVDGNPGGIGSAGDFLIVAFPFEDRIDVYDYTDASLLASFPCGEQPWVIRVDGFGDYAYVGCDIDDCCEIIDLGSLTHVATIDSFPVWLTSYGWGSESNRNFVKFSGFEVDVPGTYLMVGDGDDSVLFFNTATGEVDYSFPSIFSCDNVALSGDGNYLVALCKTDPVFLNRIDLATHMVDATAAVIGYTAGMTSEIAVDYDGSKAFISTSSNTSHLVDFLSGDAVIFNDTYSAFWVGVSGDHSLAISGQYRFSVIDFETETMVAQHQGNNQYFGDVCTGGNLAVGYDPTRHEGVYFYSFDSTSVDYLGDVLSGSEVEGDGPRRVAISPDGSVAVVSNTLSDNVSILDMASQTVEAVIYAGDRVQDVAITSDSKWAVVCGFNSNSVLIIDLDSNAVVANVPTGSRSGVVSLTPDDQYAYVGNISSNTVSVVHLDGASSTEVAELPCGVIGVVWAATGVSSDVVVSPTGEYCLVAASFDDRVKVIDTATNTIVADLTVGDFPLQIAFNDDGTRALVSNYSGDTYSLIDVDGASSSVVGTWAAGDGPLRVAYDQSGDQFAMGLYSDRQVKTVDPSTGAITGTFSYAGSGSVLDVDYAADGSRLVLTAPGSGTSCRMHRDSDMEDLSGSGVFFDYCDSTGVAVVPVPGPDYAIIVDYTPFGIEENPVMPGDLPELRLSPNPAADLFSLDVTLPSSAPVEIGVYDLGGRLVSMIVTGNLSGGEHSFSWEPDVPSGVYCIRVDAGGRSVSRLLTVCR